MRFPSLRRSAVRRPRRLLTVTAVGLSVLAAPLIAPSPAGAVNAPLTTTDGLGIRVDETAILGPALEAIETALQPFVDDMIYDGAVDSAPVSNPNAIYVSSNLELGFDILAPATGRPDGGLAVTASIQNIEIQYRKSAWWHSQCGIWVRPDNASINASARVDRTRLPNAPLTLNPITATWDDDPSTSTSGACWTYLIDDFFDSFFSSGGEESVARRIERELNGVAQDLVDDLWLENVAPVIDSLASFGITINQLRTDSYGLIVTANVNATNGVTIPGIGGPYNVAATEDAGVTSNINTLLANREEIIVSIHPNVVNQYLNALDQFLFGIYGGYSIGPSIESVLLPVGARAAYPDGDWVIDITVNDPPFTKPTGTGGAPQLQLPNVTFTFWNYGYDFATPVATFDGSMAAINLITEIRPGSDTWGPAFNESAATLNVTRTQADSNADDLAPQASSAIAPYARTGFDGFDDAIFVPYISLAPIQVYDMSVSLCTACARFTGDQRYTERFRVA